MKIVLENLADLTRQPLPGAWRYDEFDKNRDATDEKDKTITAGFNYLIKGKSLNLKVNDFRVKEEGRKINGRLPEDYNQGVIAAQVFFYNDSSANF